ncbi:MAG: hypothetical protein RSF88_11000 [Lachnospiraceae bacterium]
MKKIVIIDCYENYLDRTMFIEEYYKVRNYEVIFLIMNFNHITKKKKTDFRKNVIPIQVLPYQKNMSVKRLLSCSQFARKAYQKLKELKPDIIYALIPPNSVGKYTSLYKKRNPHVKLIWDIIDMWPESLTKGKENRCLKVPLKYWKNMRNANLNVANKIILECNLYKDILTKYVDDKKLITQYLIRQSEPFITEPLKDMNKISLGYLGSINELIDSEKIVELIRRIVQLKPVEVHIVGMGEKKEWFIQQLRLAGAKVNDYGAVYEMREKCEIFSNCHFGLNIMKKGVCVGLTIKSTDYFGLGLPIINSIPRDTKELIATYHAGFQIDNMQECVEKMVQLTEKEYIQMKLNARKLFQEQISEENFHRNAEQILE